MRFLERLISISALISTNVFALAAVADACGHERTAWALLMTAAVGWVVMLNSIAIHIYCL